MPWGAAIGAGISLIGSQMADDKKGGAGATAQQTTRDPWGPAQPWLLQNIERGQGLQNQLAAQPFSAHQQAAYGNQYALSDYMRRLAPSLLGQLGTQPLGYDQRNPLARPKAFDFASLAGAGTGAPGPGPGLGQTQLAGVQEPPPPALAPPPVDNGLGSFVQSSPGGRQGLMFARNSGALGGNQAIDSGGQSLFGGGYGTFKYGQEAPQPGTKAYRDMQEFFAYGGADPYNLYGKAPSRMAGLISSQDSGVGQGGIGAAGGAGAGSAAGGPGW